MRAFHSAAAPQFPQLATKTYAAHPVWSGSTTAEVKSQPLSRKDAARIFHEARRLERRTAISRHDAFGKVSTQGCIGRAGLLVLHAFIFDFHNYRTGRMDPSRASLAEKAGVCVRTVARAINRLRDAGILHWVRRCAGRMIDGRYVLEQESSAYGISPPARWRGHGAIAEPPRPEPEAWGACPTLQETAPERGAKASLVYWEGGQQRPLAQAVGRLGALRNNREDTES